MIGDPNLPQSQRTLQRWFNAEAFLAQEKMTPGQWGNSGRNILIGPGFNQWDISLLKNFTITEGKRLQFRAESFNIWNHASFTGLNTTVRFDSQGRQRLARVRDAGCTLLPARHSRPCSTIFTERYRTTASCRFPIIPSEPER